MKILNVFILGCSLIFLLACSSTKVLKTEQVAEFNLSTYKSFDFYSIEATGDTITGKFNDRAGKLQNAIALRLQQLGYLMTKTNPDLLVNVGIVVDKKVQTRQTDFITDAPKYVGQRRYSWNSQEVPVHTYREGTVTVDLVDRNQNKLVWTGTVQDIIPTKESKVDATIKKGVHKLFSNFPKSGG